MLKHNKTICFSDVFSSTHLIQLLAQYKNVILITDENVNGFYGEKFLKHLTTHDIDTQLIVVPAGEATKSRETKNNIEDRMLELGCSRDSVVLALGGGVVTDLAGFVAATYYRGISAIYIPTSLLAMVDASIGGKTAINTVHGKNVIGTFTEPHAVFIDVTLLTTLPEREYLSAFAEIVKHALVSDANYFSLIESHISDIRKKDAKTLLDIIKRSCEIKSAVVAADQREKSKREILNFGHTIGHAVESASDYSLSHGQAVAMGIIVESYIANQMNLLSDDDFEKIKQLIKTLNILDNIKLNFSKVAVMQFLKSDKKNRAGENRFVLLTAIGSVLQVDDMYAHTIEQSLLDKAIDMLFVCCND